MVKIKAKKTKRNKEIEKIIEEATVDCYNDDEVLYGWEVTLNENIRTQQKCTVNGNPGTLMKITSRSGSVYAVVKFDDLRRQISVPIEDLELADKRQDIYIRAYSEGFV